MMRLDRQLAGEQLVGEVEHVELLVGHGAQSRARRPRSPALPQRMETCFNSAVTPALEAAPEPESTLARSQAERRRRVLAATFELAADGGFDAVQMRDVAAAADVALGTVYRYFSSKERLLLEAMAEQQSDLRAYIETHPLVGGDRRRARDVGAAAIEPIAAPLSRRDRGDGARVRLRADTRTPTSCAGSPS